MSADPSSLTTDVVHYHSRRRPEYPAIEDPTTGEFTSWRTFEGQVAGLAGALVDDLDVAPGGRMAAIGNNHPWLLVLQFACMRLGAIFVPLNYRLAVPELAFMCTDAEAALLVHDATWADTAHRIASAAGITNLASYGVPDGPYDITPGAAQARPRGWRRSARIGDTVQLLYTSGRPKGSRCTYRTLQGQTTGADPGGGPGSHRRGRDVRHRLVTDNGYD